MSKALIKGLFLSLFIISFPIALLAQRHLPVKASQSKLITAQAIPPSNPTVCATSGADGTTNINGSINTYFPPQGNITLTAGSNSLILAGVPSTDTHGNNFGTATIKTGDLLLIIQTQDATINFDNSVLYGGNNATGGPDGLGATGFIDQGSSGKFEYVEATNNVPLTGGTLNFKGSGTGAGAVYTYTNAAATASRGKRSFQVIRVPQYSNLRLTSNISPPPFNGSAGGIIAFEVAGNMDFNGFTVDVSARGFRGGYSPVKVSAGNVSDLYVTNSTDDRASGKGEGIAGTPRYMWDGFNEVDNIIEGLPGGSDGRGAPANAGGGGNDSNAGGGGGGNGNNGGVGGLGYQPIGGSNPSSGRPGSKSFVNASPDDATRLIMGGGGGGGHANDALTGVKGGVGGGIVIINSRTISGSGTILANGGDGAPGVFGSHPDGSGGGGAGGTVFLKVSNASTTANITVNAKGGKGGNTEGDNPNVTGVQPHGPGGGGSGGLVFYNLPSGTFHSDISGGAPGKTDSGNGITHEATDGGNGLAITLNIAALPPYLQGNNSICFPVLTTTLSILDKITPKAIGGTATYVVKITNDPSAGNAEGVQAQVALPAGFSYQSATVTYQGTATGGTTLTNTGSATGVVLGDFIIPAGGTVTINLVASISCIASGTYNASAQAVYLDPTRDYTQSNRLITPKTNAFAGWNTAYQTTSFGDVAGSNYSGSTNSAEDAIVINSAISNNVIAQAPADPVFCTSGDPSVITGSTPVSTDAFTYQWQSSADNITFTDIPGANGKDYDPGIISATTYYRRAVISVSCPAAIASNVIGIQIQGTTPITNNVITASAATTFCVSGDPAVITGNTPSGGIGTFTYQWQSSADNVTFTDIAGATGQSYDPGPVSADAYYRRVVSSGNCVPPVASNVVSMKMLPAIAGNTIIAPAIITFCTTGDAAIITGSTPTGGDGIYGYQWQKSTDNISFTDIAGATGKDYDPGVITATTYYRRLVTSGPCIVPLASNAVTIIIETAVVGNSITAPAVTSFCTVGDAATIAGSIPGGGSGTYKYQWQISANNTSFTDIPGATLKDFDPVPVSANTYYRRTVLSGTCITPLISNVVSITILAVPASPVFAGTPPVICPGTSATIAINAPQAGITYNWYSSAAKDNLLFSGTSFPTAVLSTATSYYVEASNGTCGSALAQIQVSMAPTPTAPALVENPVSICAGLTATLNIQNQQAGFTYNWYNGAADEVPVHTGLSFTTPVITEGATYYVEAVNTGGCASDTRTVVNVNAVALPQIAVNSTAICPGTTATLTVIGNDSDNTILWFTSATATTPVYTGSSFTTPNLNSAASYYVEAMNSSNCNTPARMKVDVTMLQQLNAPVVSLDATTNSSVAFKWNAVAGATGYQVSIDNGQTFSQPSSGANGLNHTVSGLQFNEQVTILVQALGASSCQLSGSSTAVTGNAISPNGSQIYVANTFTPNGDGNNDIVYVHGEGIKSIAFYVYDQWGELIFTSADMSKGWDGYYKGTREPVGVYVYYVKAVTNSGLQLNKKGTITLLR